MSDPPSRRAVRAEFERAAEGFAERTAGRFDGLGAVAFSRIRPGATVLEVGAGTGNFLALFEGVASRRIAVDLTPGMLHVARRRHPGLELVVGDGARLPLPENRSTSPAAPRRCITSHIPCRSSWRCAECSRPAAGCWSWIR